MTLSPRRDGLQRGDELLDVGDALLEQVPAPRAAAGDEREGALGIRVLREDDDPEVGVGPPEALGRADALVGVGRRHPDVGEDDVGRARLDGVEQLTEVPRLDHLPDGRVLGQQGDEALPEQHAVLGEDDPHPGHGRNGRSAAGGGGRTCGYPQVGGSGIRSGRRGARTRSGPAG